MNPLKLKSITLTNTFVNQVIGKDYKSIPVRKISSISVAYSEQFYALALGILSIIISCYVVLYTTFGNGWGILFGVIGIALIVYYVITRKHIVSIGSDSLRIEETTSGVNQKTIMDFVTAVEKEIETP